MSSIMKTLDFSNHVLACSSFSIHAFSTNFGWVLDFLDNRSFQSFQLFRIRELMGLAFGEKTHKHSEIKATAGSSCFKRLKDPPVLMKDPAPSLSPSCRISLMPDSLSMGTCFIRTLEFSHDLHAAHDTNAPFFTSVGRVIYFIDNRLFQLFKQFGFRNCCWVRVLGGGENQHTFRKPVCCCQFFP